MSMSLSANPLGGSIPDELAKLVNLEYFFLWGVELTGNLPGWLGSLTKLVSIRIQGNHLTGPIPETLGNLTQLEYLWLSGNQLSGSIPPALGNLTNLQILLLQGNQLSGSIPVELAKLQNLAVLALNDNNLSGFIHKALFDDTVYTGLQSLSSLDLHNNELEGPIPTSVGNLYNLNAFSVAHNRLTGSIPAELGQLTRLVFLSLSSNKLSGTVPAQLSDLTNLGEGKLELEWNAIYSHDATLNTFIDQKSNLTYSSYLDAQVLAPEDIVVTAFTHNSVDLVWSSSNIHSYVGGGYKLYQSTSQDGPFEEVKNLTSSATSSAIYGLQGNATYWFAIRAYTDPFLHNRNTVLSDFSQVVSVTTEPGPTTKKPDSPTDDSGGGSLASSGILVLFWFLVNMATRRVSSWRTRIVREVQKSN
jgi:hypothetical protein